MSITNWNNVEPMSSKSDQLKEYIESLEVEHKDPRANHHRSKSSALSVIYESSDIIDNLNLPRTYTMTETGYSIDHNYNKNLLSSAQTLKNQSQVIGKWIQQNNKYEIHLEVLVKGHAPPSDGAQLHLVSTEENLDAGHRDHMFRKNLGFLLEVIAFAETALLKSHPELAKTKIFIHFRSLDKKYDRIESWHYLGYWTQSQDIKIKEKEEKREKKRERRKRKGRKKKREKEERKEGRKEKGRKEEI